MAVDARTVGLCVVIRRGIVVATKIISLEKCGKQ